MSKVNILRPGRLAFLFLMAVIGCFAGIALYFSSPFLPSGATKLSVSPPAKAVQLLTYQESQLFIKGADGLTYACTTVKNSCVLGSVPNLPEQRPFCGEPKPQTPLLIGTVVDTLATRMCGADGYVEIHFVVLDDGTIWRWSRAYTAYDFFGIVPLMCLEGALAGVIIGLIILWIKRWRIRRALEPNRV